MRRTLPTLPLPWLRSVARAPPRPHRDAGLPERYNRPADVLPRATEALPRATEALPRAGAAPAAKPAAG